MLLVGAPLAPPPAPTWPAAAPDGAEASPPFEKLQRVAACDGGFAFFGVVVKRNDDGRIIVRVHDPLAVNGVRNMVARAENVVAAPYALHDGLPPPPRSCDAVNSLALHLTRRDLDGRVGPEAARLTDNAIKEMFDYWNALDASPDGNDRANSRTIGFDMVQHLAGARNVPRPAEFEAETRSSANTAVVRVTRRYVTELAHELRKWLGAPVSLMFRDERSERRFTRACGTVRGIFINTKGEVVYAVHLAQERPRLAVHAISTRFDIDVHTRDATDAEGAQINNYAVYGNSDIKKGYDFKKDVKDSYAAGLRVRR